MKILLLNISYLTIECLKSFNDHFFYCATNHTPLKIISSSNVQILEANAIKNYSNLSSINNIEENIIFKIFRESDSFFHRFSNDWQLDNFHFFNSVTYWFDFFKNHEIDLVINLSNFHGNLLDIASEFSLNKNIVTIEKLYLKNEFNILLLDKLNMVYINSNESKNLAYAQHTKKYKENHFKKTLKKNSKYTLSKSAYLFRLLLKLSLFRKLIGKKTTLNEYILNSSTLRKNLKSYRIKKKYYKTISHQANFSDKYIYFPLHFEPEATLAGKTEIFKGQLNWIKLIADSLPLGTYLYVKEHPDHFKLESIDFYPFLESDSYFKSLYFYKTINSFSNVMLISELESSESLIKNSILNVSLRGTTILESIKAKKTILILEPKFSILSKSHYSVTFDNINDIKKYISSFSYNLNLDDDPQDDFSQYIHNFDLENQSLSIIETSIKYYSEVKKDLIKL